MPSTLLLDRAAWDLVVDSYGDIAVASEPYSLAQDAASAIQTWLGEVYYDTTVGVPWLNILGQTPALALLKSTLAGVAEQVDGVAAAQVFISSLTNRNVSGQVQVAPESGGPAQYASFSVVNPQGV